MSAAETANAQQSAASNPGVSAFVAASAGSGKTKLLTDRLLRLMLAGTRPEKLLCLTYTKAAAAEMVLRLNSRLGAWVVMAELELARELSALEVPASPENLALARRIFADVLDLPGGMRIGTIHAFCQSLLRRFPLEAGLSPHFEVADETTSFSRLREARESVLADPNHRQAIMALAAETDEQSFATLTTEFAEHSGTVLREFAPEAIAAMQHAALGTNGATEAQLLAQGVAFPGDSTLARTLRQVAGAGTPSGQEWAAQALDWLAKPERDRVAAWAAWEELFFINSGERRKLGRYLGKKLAAFETEIEAEISLECRRLEAIQEKLRAAHLARLNAHLMVLAGPILHADGADRSLQAHLNYGDLINLTGRLLINPGAAWVLYKLDGGIDHLLLDEVQDTAPAQWEIADAIAEEFFAGAGARTQTRSIFAVGDAKQSIFSFQGADLHSFGHYRTKFRAKLRAAGLPWLDGELSVSFRSTAPVLTLVDAVFASGQARCGVVAADETLAHGLSRAGQAGSVSLWPLTRQDEPPALPPWEVPDHYERAVSAKTRLASEIAAHIRARLDAGEILHSHGRAIMPGDFLILVRRRDTLVTAITRALKAQDIPVAGLDRMILTEQQAVSDMLALCDALLLPEDDLAFAQFLASPLGGLEDASLMDLALHRRGSLVAALYARAGERGDWTQAKEFFETLRRRVDFQPPFALLSEALGGLGGRARILARLGPEAAEPLEEFLAEALEFSQNEPGALQNFVHQLRQSGASIKREPESGAQLVRIMTVHGAKGLQAPIVILPDTTSVPDTRQRLLWLPTPQQPGLSVPIFCPRRELRSAAVTNAASLADAARTEEYNRLLYVALTRAEDALIICGAQGANTPPENCWYALAKVGFERLQGAPQAGEAYHFACPQTAPPDRPSTSQTARPVTLPAWAGAAPDWAASAPPHEHTRPERLAPSRSTEDTARQAISASPLGADLASWRSARAAALDRGRAVHALLQHLPALAPDARQAAALRYLANIPALAAQAADICTAVLAVLHNPALQMLFGPHSWAEIPLVGVVRDVQIGGMVDRLAVTENSVLLADYKTDRQPPASAQDIPPGYLRQLAAYQAILAQIYPDRSINCLLIWTETAKVMPIPPALLASHAPA